MNMARKIPTGRKRPTVADRLRARVFCLCKDLGIDETGRRVLAGTCRKDGRETMQGMSAYELYDVVVALGKIRNPKSETQNPKSQIPNPKSGANPPAPQSEAWKEKRRAQKKRIHGLDRPEIASEPARFVLRELAKAFYGREWSARLNSLLMTKHNAGYFITHDQPNLPTRTVWEATEALKVMLAR